MALPGKWELLNRARESWKSAFGVGLLWRPRTRSARTRKAKLSSMPCWAETGLTMDQVRRWRREGLLPEVVQDQQAYRGSVVLYPKGTCAQIRAASALFKQKNRADYVGVRLWRLGFPVDEKHWRPRLQRQGRTLDRAFPFLCGLLRDSIEIGKTKLCTIMRRSDWSRSTVWSFPGSKGELIPRTCQPSSMSLATWYGGVQRLRNFDPRRRAGERQSIHNLSV
jgi:hypothetical protein